MGNSGRVNVGTWKATHPQLIPLRKISLLLDMDGVIHEVGKYCGHRENPGRRHLIQKSLIAHVFYRMANGISLAMLPSDLLTCRVQRVEFVSNI